MQFQKWKKREKCQSIANVNSYDKNTVSYSCSWQFYSINCDISSKTTSKKIRQIGVWLWNLQTNKLPYTALWLYPFEWKFEIVLLKRATEFNSIKLFVFFRCFLYLNMWLTRYVCKSILLLCWDNTNLENSYVSSSYHQYICFYFFFFLLFLYHFSNEKYS